MPWKKLCYRENGDDWNDADDAHLRIWLEKNWRLRDEDADERPYHPVKNYLDKLEWDGQPRVETMLMDYLGAADTNLNRAYARKWAAAVKRVLEPGCKFDYCLPLIGGQGIGKSTLAQKLSQGYFTDTLPKSTARKAMKPCGGYGSAKLPR